MPIAARSNLGPVVYGWDQSHYDGTITTALMVKAKAEGIAFATHKLGEGLGGADDTATGALAAARDAGIPVIGGYWFCHNADDPIAEADRAVARADKVASWWRDFPAWVWQADCETETGEGKPTLSWIVKFADRLVSTTGRVCLVYASHGEYGDTLRGLGHPLWNASYPSSRAGSPAAIYPGNTYAGWSPYSGQTPVIAQFSSSATIAGRTTCDANAFRGTVADLLTLIGADMALTGADSQTVFETDGFVPNYPWAADLKTNATIKPISAIIDAGNEAHNANVGVAAIAATLAGIVKTEAAIQAAIAAIQKGGTSPDTATIIAAIQAVGTQESAHVTALQQQLTTAAATITALKADLLAAAQAAATDLAK